MASRQHAAGVSHGPDREGVHGHSGLRSQRGMGHGLVRLFAEDGTLLATASQSVIVRLFKEGFERRGEHQRWCLRCEASPLLMVADMTLPSTVGHERRSELRFRWAQFFEEASVRRLLLCLSLIGALLTVAPTSASAAAALPGSYSAVVTGSLSDGSYFVRLAMYSFQSGGTFRQDFWYWNSKQSNPRAEAGPNIGTVGGQSAADSAKKVVSSSAFIAGRPRPTSAHGSRSVPA